MILFVIFAAPFPQILPDFDEAVDLPDEIHDPNSSGLEVDTKLRCYHGEVPARSVTKHKANGVKTSMEHQKL
jgi:hypothetical protein